MSIDYESSMVSEDWVMLQTAPFNPFPERNARDIGRVVARRPYGWVLGEIDGDTFYSDINPSFNDGEIVPIMDIGRHDLRFCIGTSGVNHV
jgi:hypothetical protein